LDKRRRLGLNYDARAYSAFKATLDDLSKRSIAPLLPRLGTPDQKPFLGSLLGNLVNSAS
jgi:hypothetical protein